MADYGGSITISQARELSHTSDEDEENSPRSRGVPPPAEFPSGGPSRPKITITNKRGTAAEALGGGGSEIAACAAAPRKPRGRPLGSKNKPKPPIVVTTESESAMKPVVLEISVGSDVIETVTQFGRRRQLGISILSASGAVSNVTLRHPVSQAPNLTIHGPFNILSFTGTFLPSSSASSSFGISLAGSQGHVFGGIVAGEVVAATQVLVVAATFVAPTFHRLPARPEETDHEAKPGGGGCSGSTGGGGASHEAGCSSTCMSMSAYGVASPVPLNCQISPDNVLPWGGSTSRPPLY